MNVQGVDKVLCEYSFFHKYGHEDGPVKNPCASDPWKWQSKAHPDQAQEHFKAFSSSLFRR